MSNNLKRKVYVEDNATEAANPTDYGIASMVMSLNGGLEQKSSLPANQRNRLELKVSRSLEPALDNATDHDRRSVNNNNKIQLVKQLNSQNSQ